MLVGGGVVVRSHDDDAPHRAPIKKKIKQMLRATSATAKNVIIL